MMMETLQVAPLEWSMLRDIDDTEPLGEHDYACIKEVREVLKKHGKQERLGVVLIHRHAFDLADDEILIEECDSVTRTLITRPVRASEVGDNKIGTAWMLRDGNEPLQWCRKYCYRGWLGHSKDHNSVPGR